MHALAARLARAADAPLARWIQTHTARLDARIGVAYALHMQRRPRTLPLADSTFRTRGVDAVRDLRAGTILRAEDGTRAIQIGYRWRVEPPGDTDADVRVVESAEIAGRPWQVEAYGPPYKAHSEVVYLDLDGTGRKVYRADASKYEIERYEKAAKVYQKARDAGQDAKAPDSPALYYVEHAGVRYALAPTTWYGVSDAVSWYVVGTPEASRRAKAAQTADRRTLTPDAARALAAMVLHVLPEAASAGRSTYALTVTDIRRDMQENRRDMFVPLRDDAAFEAYPWRVAFPANDADTALLSDAIDRPAVAERLIGAAVRQLIADGWAAEASRRRGRGEYVTGYVRGERALPSARVEALTRWDGPRDRADKARSAAEARLRAGSRSDYAQGRGPTAWMAEPAYARLQDAAAAMRAAHGAAAHPFATEADVTALAGAVARLHAEADAVPAANE